MRRFERMSLRAYPVQCDEQLVHLVRKRGHWILVMNAAAVVRIDVKTVHLLRLAHACASERTRSMSLIESAGVPTCPFLHLIVNEANDLMFIALQRDVATNNAECIGDD